MSAGLIVGIVVACVLVCLLVIKINPGNVLDRLKTVSVTEVLDAFATGAVVATKAWHHLLPMTDDHTRKYLLATWYWFVFSGDGIISEEHLKGFRSAWEDLSSEYKKEAADAYMDLVEGHRDLLAEQIASVLRKKNIDVAKLKEILCVISDRKVFLKHCSCEEAT